MSMDNNDYNKIVDAIKTIVTDLDDSSYSIVPLNGKRGDGQPISCVMVYVCNQNYLQVDSDQFISFNEIFPQTKYQIPKYHCSPDKDGYYSLFKGEKKVISETNFSIESLIKECFDDVKNKLQNKEEVAELLGELMEHPILPNQLEYDAYAQTYFLHEGNNAADRTEYLWFSNYFRELKKSFQKPFPFDSCHVAKYTSLDTALKILVSGKMRMMSVTAMNDKLEIGYLYGKLSDEDAAYLDNKTIFHNARQRYITSFTNKIDDLTMWRLYGDDGKGVCLVFSEPDECQYYFPVDYSGAKSEICQRAKKICDDLLNNHGIRFTFKSLETTWQYFLKKKGFRDESEMRYLRIDKSKPDGYLLASNGIISGYKQLSLIPDEKHPEVVFPATLQGIILGPNMKNSERNKLQLEAIASENHLLLIKGVHCSSINYYLS